MILQKKGTLLVLMNPMCGIWKMKRINKQVGGIIMPQEKEYGKNKAGNKEKYYMGYLTVNGLACSLHPL